jgi:S1-C subfamily serine protease
VQRAVDYYHARVALAKVLAVVSLGAALAGSQRVAGQEQPEFPRIISLAQSEVFPALVFVKPIVAEYDSGEKKQEEVFGSGVIISPDDYAVTNWHVVDKAVAINCVLYDKRQVEAKEPLGVLKSLLPDL